MAALRDKIIHGYFRIDYSIIWSVITDDLPEIEPKISALIKELEASPALHRPASGKP